MPAAGEYATPLTWLRMVAGTPDEYGQKPKQASEPELLGVLWAAVEDVAANREGRVGAERQVTTATIRVRNWLGIAAGDYLRDTADGTEWKVLTVVYGDDETVCDVEQ